MSDTGDGVSDDSVDEAILSELFELMGEGGAEGLVDACNMFLDGVPARLAEAEGAVSAEHYDEAARVAHSLRGTAGAFGAARLSRLADQLEQACKESAGASATAVIDELRSEFETFARILGERLQQATDGR